MITRKDVEHISWLASIKVAEEEKDDFVDQFNSVLDYFQQLDEVDTEDVTPTYRAVELINVFREDEPRESLPQEESLRNAPKQKNEYFRGPRIV
ncbi:MAG: Asp-tRNA(Asn)/Glu-tRNA(Gln) amidotransferase subunit GatC [Methanotrichaceae archaeon]